MFPKKVLPTLGVIFILLSFKGDKAPYKIYAEKGEKSSYDKMLKATEDAEIILFGELQNNPINHWLQFELTKDVFNRVGDLLVLGAEMFEADNQFTINEYLGGHHTYHTFKDEVKIWPNNKTDYQPLMDFAMSHQLSFTATNIPKRYTDIVYINGFGGLNSMSPEAKKWIAPLPIKYDKELPGYKKILEMVGNNSNENLPKVQAIQDATMAYFILKNWTKGQTFIHYNGTNHSDNFEGIVWYLRQANPDLKIMTIGSVEQEKIDSLAEKSIGIANFIVCTPTSMTKTH